MWHLFHYLGFKYSFCLYTHQLIWKIYLPTPTLHSPWAFLFSPFSKAMMVLSKSINNVSKVRKPITTTEDPQFTNCLRLLLWIYNKLLEKTNQIGEDGVELNVTAHPLKHQLDDQQSFLWSWMKTLLKRTIVFQSLRHQWVHNLFSPWAKINLHEWYYQLQCVWLFFVQIIIM